MQPLVHHAEVAFIHGYGAADEGSVDIDASHIVYNDGDFFSRFIFQKLVQYGRFPRAKIAGEDRDRCFLMTAHLHHTILALIR